MKLWKYSGTYLALTGVLHTVLGLVVRRDIYRAMIAEGFFDSVGGDYARGTAFWFLICGIFLILSGTLLQHYLKATRQPAPNFFGYALLGLAVVGCLAAPVSGFWLLIPQALIIILGNRRFDRRYP